MDVADCVPLDECGQAYKGKKRGGDVDMQYCGFLPLAPLLVGYRLTTTTRTETTNTFAAAAGTALAWSAYIETGITVVLIVLFQALGLVKNVNGSMSMFSVASEDVSASDVDKLRSELDALKANGSPTNNGKKAGGIGASATDRE